MLRLERFQVKQAMTPYTFVLFRYYNSLLQLVRQEKNAAQGRVSAGFD